ncbi:hypothetical protein FBU30_006976 [Linnemannia zychae]|nr:hypothetical protein FBU30_006976 [Linnemannia zychae]
MQLKDFNIRNTRPDEVDKFIDILESVAERLHANNIRQWPPGMFRNPTARADMLTGIANKQYFTIDYCPSSGNPNIDTPDSTEYEMAGLFLINYDDPFDELLWKDYLAEQGQDWKNGLYLHRLVLMTPFKGIGLTSKIVEFAEQKVRESGRQFLRLDCMADNERLRRFYGQQCRGSGKGGLIEQPTVWNPELELEFARFELQVVPFRVDLQTD